MSCLWVFLAFLFNGGIYSVYGTEKALEFFTGYLVEKSLSVDNLLVILLIFTHFKVPASEQHKILLLGIIGALVFRLVLILVGLHLIDQVHWMSYILGVFLTFTALKMLKSALSKDKKLPSVVSFLSGGKPLDWKRAKGSAFLITLLAIEGTDLIFALDSLPAIFAISHDPMIVYTSNAFAILGLRELYFLIAGGLKKIRLLPFGLSAILLFVGLKMLLEPFFQVPLLVSLGVVILILGVTTFFSWRLDKSIKRK